MDNIFLYKLATISFSAAFISGRVGDLRGCVAVEAGGVVDDGEQWP